MSPNLRRATGLSIVSLLLLFAGASCRGPATLGGHSFPPDLAPQIRSASAFLDGNAKIIAAAGDDHWFQGASVVHEVGARHREVHTELRTDKERGAIKLVLSPKGDSDDWQVTGAVLSWRGAEHSLMPAR